MANTAPTSVELEVLTEASVVMRDARGDSAALANVRAHAAALIDRTLAPMVARGLDADEVLDQIDARLEAAL